MKKTIYHTGKYIESFPFSSSLRMSKQDLFRRKLSIDLFQFFHLHRTMTIMLPIGI